MLIRKFLILQQKKFVTNFVTRITNFVTCVRNFVTLVTNFVINFFLADSKKLLADGEKYQGEKKNYLRTCHRKDTKKGVTRRSRLSQI